MTATRYMQPLDLALVIGRRRSAAIERSGRLILQLLLPRVDLVGMHLVTLRQVRHRLLLSQRLERDLRLQRPIKLTPRSLRHRLLRLVRNSLNLQLALWSRKLGPLDASASATMPPKSPRHRPDASHCPSQKDSHRYSCSLFAFLPPHRDATRFASHANSANDSQNHIILMSTESLRNRSFSMSHTPNCNRCKADARFHQCVFLHLINNMWLPCRISKRGRTMQMNWRENERPRGIRTVIGLEVVRRNR